MSAHNHDDEIIRRSFGNTKKGASLQKKADDAIDEKIKRTLLSTDITGLSGDAAKQKLKSAIDDIFDK